ncbi:MAG: hypothetical protein D6B26_03985 [Spirochaetaceae bacterium]|nr:MAG: hypothetical protein D6B26_03985 [Spirochaetaceae bacterium]
MISRETLLRTIGILLIFLIMYLAMVPFAPYLQSAGDFLALHVGLPGAFLYVFLVDTFIVPVVPDFILPMMTDWPLIPVIMTICSASILGGFSGYWIGRLLGHLRIVQYLTSSYRARGEERLRRSGFWAVAIAALTPVPYSTISWIAGMLKIPLVTYIFAALFRIPRLAFAYLLIRSGTELLSGI